MGYLLEHYRAVADPFMRGHTPAQVGLMMFTLQGLKVPYVNGAVVLMRKRLYPDPTVEPWLYVGTALGAATQIKNAPGFGHDADQAYLYTSVKMLGNGMISVMAEPQRVDFDGAGNLITPRLPNWPSELVVQRAAGGTFELTWSYDAFGQGDNPADFQVFEGATPDTIDYGTPLVDSVTGLDIVAFDGARNIYQFATQAYADQTEHAFGVRSRSSAGVAELNTFTTEINKARSVVPANAAAAVSGFVHQRGRTGDSD